MANYQSIPRRFNRPTSSINHTYIDATLKSKQSTIDTNFGILQESVTETLGQDFAREQDRDMLKGKVQGVMNTLERTDEIQFDSSKARHSIQGALSQAAKDPEVLKQIANTKRVRQVQQFYQERAKKGDLNEQNFNYAYKKSGIDSYMSGDSDDVGSFNYSEYVDVDAKMDEVARKLKATNKNEEISITNPLTGQTVSKKVSQVTPNEMRNYLRVQLNANDLKQMEIDGAMMYGMDDSKAIQYRDELISKNNSDFNEKVSYLENKRDNTGNITKGQIADINAEIESLGAEKSMYEQRMIGNKTAEAIGGQQLIENKVNMYSNLYTKNGPESINYDADALKRMRDANAASSLGSQTVRSNPNISTITTATDLPDNVDPYRDGLKRVDKVLNDNSDYLKTTFRDLNADQKKLVNKTMEDIKSDPEFLSQFKGQNLSDETLQLETVNRLGPNFFPPDVANELRTRISSTKAIQEGQNKLTNDYVTSVVGQEEMFDQLYEEETALTMVTPEGEVNIQQFLKDNGVKDLESYKSFIAGGSEEAKKLKATVSLQSMSLTNDVTTDDFYFWTDDRGVQQRFNGQGVVGATNTTDLTESEYRIMRNSVNDLTGESLEETYDVEKRGEDYVLTMKNPNTQFANIVTKTNELYQRGRITDPRNHLNPFDTDRTVRNESAIRDKFNEDSYRAFASQNMNYLDNTVAGSNAIRIRGDKDQKIGPVFQEVLSKVSNTNAFDKKKDIDIYRRADNSLLVTQSSTILDEDGEPKIKLIQGEVLANDVDGLQMFNEQISLQQKETSFKTLENIAGDVDKMTFIGNNNSQVDGLNRLYDRSNPKEDMFRLMATEQTARKMIFNPMVEKLVNSSRKGQEIKAQFEDFVTNTHDYKLKFSKGVDTDYQVVINDKKGDQVGVVPINKGISIDLFEKAYQGTPQVFLTMHTRSEINKLDNSRINAR